MTAMDINQVMALLPHRYPFLLVDRVLSCEPGQSILALKNVSVNEPFFQGHFPGKPVMPGVLIIEAMAQACCLLAKQTASAEQVAEEAIYLLVGVDNARFKRQVLPGDSLQLQADLVKHKRDLWIFNAQVMVDGVVAASAEIKCTAREI